MTLGGRGWLPSPARSGCAPLSTWDHHGDFREGVEEGGQRMNRKGP